ncbi:MAG: hypothetical protein LBR73_00455 [Oscillospiraceae bacterium]|jgi:hypothetical protein|nr:hypothetical protein [Oscillospiraceae bacterium]
MREAYRLLLKFTCSAAIGLGITAAGCGFFYVGETTEYLSAGNKTTQVGYSSDKQTVTIAEREYKPTDTIEKVLEWTKLAPAPLGAILWILSGE